MLLANFNGKEHLRHRAVSLRQHGFLVIIDIHLLLAAHKRILALCWPFNQFILYLFHCVHCENVFIWLMNFN